MTKILKYITNYLEFKLKRFKEITPKININDSAIRAIIYNEMNCH